MNEPRNCPKCGAALPGDAMDGLCPKCMGRVVFGQQEGPRPQPEDKPEAVNQVERPMDATVEGPGMRIGRYKLLEQIGEGGFGVVYMAQQVEPVRRKVALKVVKAGMDTKEVIARFEAERQALALMDHPNIARVLDAGATEAGRPYFVMELVKGIPITEFCDLKKLPPAGRLDLFIKVCQAVQHAHQKGIIHRDLKPSNVLVTLHDGVPVPKVIDFGIAKALGPKLTEKTLFTGFAHLLGTPAYMSPEQAELSGLDIDTRSDIYSLGVLLYELLTGVTPFDKETLAKAALDEVRRMIRETEPPKPSTRLRTLGEKLTEVANSRHTEPPKLIHLVRGDLDWIVMKCLEKDRRRRYETANGLAMDAQRHLNDEPVVARPPSVGYRFQKFVQRNRVAVVVASGFILLLTAAVVVSTALAVWAKAKERQARESEADAKAVLQFFEANVLAAARPEGQEGGLGRDATIRAAVDAAEPSIAKAFTNRPLVEAAIREVVGTTYNYLGEAERAAEQHRRALELRRPLLGLEHLDTVSAMVWLAEDLRLAGRPAEAIPLLEQALKVSDKIWGRTHTNTFCVMNDLGLSYFEIGRTKEGIALFEKTKNLRVEHLGLQHPDTLASLVNLGDKYRAVGRGLDAVPLLEQAVEIARTNLSPHHPDTLTTMNNLALAYSAVGDFPRATEVQQEVLEQRRILLPADHPLLLASSNNVALAWRDMGRFPEALALLEKTAQHSREVLGTNHRYTITFFNNVALVAEDAGDTNKALRLFEETFNQRRTLLGPDHPATLRAMNYWARALMRSGQLDKAETLLRESEQRWRATEPWNVATAGLTLANLARCLLLKDDPVGAEARAREYLELAKENPPRPWCKAEASGLLGAALLDQGQFKAAETNLLAAFDELQANYARVPAHVGPRLRQSIGQWIIQLQQALGRSDLAEQWRQRLKRLEELQKQ